MRRFSVLAGVLLTLALPVTAAVSPEFAARRAEIRKSIPNGILVLFGNKDSDDIHQPFFQQTDFYYLSGWEEPGAILVVTPAREILFLPKPVEGQARWTGRNTGPADPGVAGLSGFQTNLPAERFESELRKLLDENTDLYGTDLNTLGKLAPLRAVRDAQPLIARLRMVKSAAEIAAIQHATDASIDGHRAVWRSLHPGEYEYQAEAAMVGTWLNEGCRRSAYAPTVGSGPNSLTLHYSRNLRRMQAGELVLMDAGAECDNYASDITRTVPVSGKFTARQREIYDIVLGAQRATIAAVKPGVTLGRAGLYKVAYDYIDSHGKDLHGETLGRYFTHGVSHHVGLDVHDPADLAEPLRAGMVITIEPGVYIPEENIGVRIEDTVLVTEAGARVMSAALPTDPDEIERALARRN